MPAHLVPGWLLLAFPQQAAAAPAASALDEVVANVQSQPLGPGTVADLALPDELLRRIADRILRRSFEESFRVVVADPPAAEQAPPGAAPGTQPAPAPAKERRSGFRRALDVLALAAGAVLVVLGIFALKARAKRDG
jgi:hypothetical protein